MSYRYQEMIVPDVDHIYHRPSPAQFRAALDVLVEEGWCSPLDNAEQLVDGVPAAVVQLDLSGKGAIAGDDWPDGETLITPDLCDTVKVINSPRLLVYGGDAMSANFSCPSCEKQIRGAWSELQDEIAFRDDAPPEYKLTWNGLMFAPDRCPLCEAAIDPKNLLTQWPDGDIAPPPLYYFAFRIQTLRQPTVRQVFLVPRFLEQLGAAIGVPLRSMGGLA